MVLYIVRHGETDWNVEHRYLGSTDLPLNERGLEQAAALADRFRDIPLAAVYASDLSRSYQTAEIIGRPHVCRFQFYLNCVNSVLEIGRGFLSRR